MREQQTVSRREFVRRTLAGGLALAIPHVAKANADGQRKEPPRVQYRTLGRTGLKVSVVGFGAMRTSDPNVIHHALDLGVNYIDTACCYMDGNNEVIVGTVLKSRRDDTYIATKVHIASEKKMMASVERSLKRLQTDVIDVIQLHSMKKREHVLNETAMNALDKMRKKGYVRFVGFSTHKNQVECIDAGIESGFYDMVLVTYSFKTDPEIEKAIARAAKAGMGVVAMKTQAGGYKKHDLGDWSPHQAALRWVLRNPNVATTIPSMVSFAQVDENVAVMGTKFGARDAKALERYGQLLDHEICRFCQDCDDRCPAGVSLIDVNRVLMYADGYGDLDLALRTAKQEGTAETLQACAACSECLVRCDYGLNLSERVRRVRELVGAMA